MILGASVLVALASFVIGALLAARVRVPPVFVGLFVTLPVVAAATLSRFLADGSAVSAAEQVPMGARSMIYAQTMQSGVATWSFAGVATLGVFVLLVGCATGAVRATRKVPGLAAIPILLGGAMLLGSLRDRVLFSDSFGGLEHWIGIPVLLLFLLVTALAFVGADPENAEDRSAGFESAACAGLGFLGAVLAIEVGALGGSWAQIFDALGSVSGEMYPTLLANAAGVVAPASQRGLATAAWAAAVALGGVGIGATATGARRLGVLLAMPCALLGPILLLTADPTQALLEFEEREQERFSAPPSRYYQLPVGEDGRYSTPARSTVLRITSREVTVDGQGPMPLATSEDAVGMEQVRLPPSSLEAIRERLVQERSRWDAVPTVGADDPAARRLVIQADKRIPWQVLGPLLEVATDAGYTDLELALLMGWVSPRLASEDAKLDGLPVVQLGTDRLTVGESEPIPIVVDDDSPAVRAALIAARDVSGADEMVLVPDGDVSWDQVVAWMIRARAVEPLEDRSPWSDGTPLFPTVWLADPSLLPEPEPEPDSE